MSSLAFVPPSRPALAERLRAAFGAFLAPERQQPVANDNDRHPGIDRTVSLVDPLAFPPDWQGGGDLLSLSFLPFDR